VARSCAADLPRSARAPDRARRPHPPPRTTRAVAGRHRVVRRLLAPDAPRP
jgi:hypothetical protein